MRKIYWQYLRPGQMILSIGTDVSVRSTIKRNTDWVKLTRGLLYYYGTLNTSPTGRNGGETYE